jgi:ferric-dicitrate binding protein FerR (iron transport regulator)
MTDETPAAQLAAIVERLCWREATPADLAALDELLAAHPDLWPAYQDAVHLHVCLRQRFAVLPAPAAPPVRRTWRRAVFALVGCAAAVLVAWVALRPAASPRAFATLTGLQGELADGDAALTSGRVRLVAGLAEVTFQSGTVVVLEGPAELDLAGPARGVLVNGRLAAKVPADAGEFALDTPAARVTEGASEFGVAVTPDGETVVQVYGGTVRAGDREIAAGDAVSFGGTDSGRAVVFDATRFVREMPPFETRPGSGNDQKTPYNQATSSGMRIPFAPRPPRIDADLGEWDRVLAVSGRCDPPFDEAYRATLFAAYDDTALYLAAEVADPNPLRNRADVATGTETWAGGSVIVRLSTDPTLGYPVDQRKPDLNLRRPPTPQNTSDRLNHLILWYSRPDDRACLDASFGMDEHGKRRNPAGATGAAKQWPDGRGYTMEYAVPWAALAGPDARPRPGDATGICWQVHWADAAGRVWRGQLIEVLTPGETGLVFHNARRWGRADWLVPGTR